MTIDSQQPEKASPTNNLYVVNWPTNTWIAGQNYRPVRPFILAPPTLCRHYYIFRIPLIKRFRIPNSNSKKTAPLTKFLRLVSFRLNQQANRPVWVLYRANNSTQNESNKSEKECDRQDLFFFCFPRCFFFI